MLRYCLISSLLACFAVVTSEGQDKKPGKDKDGKDAPKEIDKYLDKDFKAWKAELKSKDPSKRAQAMKNLLQFGPVKAYEAVQDILDQLKKHTPTTPIDLDVRVSGTMALSTIFKYKERPDPKDKEALAAYQKHLKEALAIYRGFLKDDQLLLRIRAMQGLPYLGRDCLVALPDVIKMAREPSTWEARKEAIQLLAIMGFNEKGDPSGNIIGEVLKAFDDPSGQVRVAGVHSVTRLGSVATPEQKVPIFNKLRTLIASDPDDHVVIAAHMSMMTIPKKVNPQHFDPLLSMVVKNPDPGVRIDAIQNIAMCGKDAAPAVPTLLKAIHDPEVAVGVAAITALAQMLEPPQSIPMFQKLKDDMNVHEVLRETAVEALAFIDVREKMKKEMKDKKIDKK